MSPSRYDAATGAQGQTLSIVFPMRPGYHEVQMNPPQNPAGEFHPENDYEANRRNEFIVEIENAPILLRKAASGLSQGQLDTRFRNWTVRQIVHHMADSHVNSYIRFKWSLTEDLPIIKDYNEANWVALDDSKCGDISAPLALLDGLHQCWVQLLRCMTSDQFLRSFVHPATGKRIRLCDALCYYAWHCRHHTGQINWLRRQYNW